MVILPEFSGTDKAQLCLSNVAGSMHKEMVSWAGVVSSHAISSESAAKMYGVSSFKLCKLSHFPYSFLMDVFQNT